jgi:hypothetical protein
MEEKKFKTSRLPTSLGTDLPLAPPSHTDSSTT